MLRKLGVITAALVAIVSSASPAGAAGLAPRTATSTELVTGWGVYIALTGEAVETDVTTGSTTSFTASCEAGQLVTGGAPLPAIPYHPFRLQPDCWVRNVTTGRVHHLASVISTDNFTAAAGIVDGPAGDDYELCVGFYAYYPPPDDEYAVIHHSPCKPLLRGV